MRNKPKLTRPVATERPRSTPLRMATSSYLFWYDKGFAVLSFDILIGFIAVGKYFLLAVEEKLLITDAIGDIGQETK